MNARKISNTTLLIGVIATFVFGFFVRPDPQSGLMFVVLPLYQLLVAVPLLIATFVVTRRR